MKQPPDRTANSWRNHRFYCGPFNEAIELRDSYRILYNSIEVAALSYCESYRWAEMYAAAPELLAACQAFLNYGCKGQTPDGRWVRDIVSAAVIKATGESL
jgi:hypothetical protein